MYCPRQQKWMISEWKSWMKTKYLFHQVQHHFLRHGLSAEGRERTTCLSDSWHIFLLCLLSLPACRAEISFPWRKIMYVKGFEDKRAKASEVAQVKDRSYQLIKNQFCGYRTKKSCMDILEREDISEEHFGSAVPAFHPKFYLTMTKPMADEREAVAAGAVSSEWIHLRSKCREHFWTFTLLMAAILDFTSRHQTQQKEYYSGEKSVRT
ncbi:uncharacterized protein LOC135282937 isoform X2 [Passer domesticus]|uniref:uncharacterized protein LOC135282937 isoform X2 n=1 Tax=Passer domesticus TaxID=48849 RepID=UPI0030FEF495